MKGNESITNNLRNNVNNIGRKMSNVRNTLGNNVNIAEKKMVFKKELKFKFNSKGKD